VCQSSRQFPSWTIVLSKRELAVIPFGFGGAIRVAALPSFFCPVIQLCSNIPFCIHPPFSLGSRSALQLARTCPSAWCCLAECVFRSAAQITATAIRRPAGEHRFFPHPEWELSFSFPFCIILLLVTSLPILSSLLRAALRLRCLPIMAIYCNELALGFAARAVRADRHASADSRGHFRMFSDGKY